jgi:hypothetical protein
MRETAKTKLPRGLAVLVVVTACALGGCYEETAPPQQAQSAQPPAPPEQPTGGPPTTGMDNQPAPSYSGAQGAAQRTADRIGQRQQELEDALNEE